MLLPCDKAKAGIESYFRLKKVAPIIEILDG